MRKVITVDGLAGSGKSSISTRLAARLGFRHLSSGLLYRGLAYLAMKRGVDTSKESLLTEILQSHKLTLGSDGTGASKLIVDGVPVDADLMVDSISKGASKIAAFQKVRELLIPSQREAYSGHGIVAEGRDMGTVIFPHADAKFFIVVDPQIRANRRTSQIGGKGEEVLREILDRDERDTTRNVSPAVPAPDAVTIDNSHETLDNVVEKMVSILKEKGVFAP